MSGFKPIFQAYLLSLISIGFVSVASSSTQGARLHCATKLLETESHIVQQDLAERGLSIKQTLVQRYHILPQDFGTDSETIKTLETQTKAVAQLCAFWYRSQHLNQMLVGEPPLDPELDFHTVEIWPGENPSGFPWIFRRKSPILSKVEGTGTLVLTMPPLSDGYQVIPFKELRELMLEGTHLSKLDRLAWLKVRKGRAKLKEKLEKIRGMLLPFMSQLSQSARAVGAELGQLLSKANPQSGELSFHASLAGILEVHVESRSESERKKWLEPLETMEPNTLRAFLATFQKVLEEDSAPARWLEDLSLRVLQESQAPRTIVDRRITIAPVIIRSQDYVSVATQSGPRLVVVEPIEQGYKFFGFHINVGLLVVDTLDNVDVRVSVRRGASVLLALQQALAKFRSKPQTDLE